MQIEDLHKQLKEAYSEQNLNTLSSKIITLYKNKDETILRRIHRMIYPGSNDVGAPISRIFSRIIMNYHPDRKEQLHNTLEQYLIRGDVKGMTTLNHILEVQDLDTANVIYDTISDPDIGWEDIWDDTMGGYSYIDEEGNEEDDYGFMEDMMQRHDFLAAVKRKVYGYMSVDFPVHLLADMEIIEMSEYEIEELEGIEYCTYARIVDLSNNNLTEVSRLGYLLRLEEVYLQNNQIGYLDGLQNLPYLRVLDISFNDLDDLSPILELDTLEFLNVMGNRIPGWQLEQLSKAGVVVVA